MLRPPWQSHHQQLAQLIEGKGILERDRQAADLVAA